MVSSGQIPWPSPGRTRDRHRAGLTTASGQNSMALDTGLNHLDKFRPAGNTRSVRRRTPQVCGYAVRVLRFIRAACLVYILWLPVSQQQVLFPVLATLALTSVAIAASQRLHWEAPFLGVWYLLGIAVAFMLLVGSLQSTPGWTHQALVWGGGIAIWSLWGKAIRTDSIRSTLTLLTVGTLALSTLMVLYTASQLGILPNFIPDSITTTQGAGFLLTDEGSNIRFVSLSTLAAAGPLVISGALFSGGDTLAPRRWLLVAASVMALLAAGTSGRRAILVVCVLAPVVAFVAQWFFSNRKRRISELSSWFMILPPVALIVAFVSGQYGLLDRAVAALRDVLSLYLGFGSGGTSKSGVSDLVRQTQANQLLDGWASSPFFGSGSGAVLSSGFARSADRPWQFELQYLQLLFNGGLVGAIIVAAAVLFGIIAIRRAAIMFPEHRGILIMTSTAAVSLLAANASNPYLQADAHWWGVVLVLGVVNALVRSSASADRDGAARLEPISTVVLKGDRETTARGESLIEGRVLDG